MKKVLFLLLAASILCSFLVSCRGQETSQEEPGEHPESLLFDIDSALFEVEDSSGRKLTWEGDKPTADSTIEVRSKSYHMGSLGRSLADDQSYLTIELPYSSQYTFRKETAGIAIQEHESDANVRVYGEELRTAVWNASSVSLTGEASECGIELYRGGSSSAKLRMKLLLSYEDHITLAWDETTASVSGASGQVVITLWNMSRKSKPETVSIDGDFTLDTANLKEGKLTISDQSGSRTVDLTWENG